MKLQLIESKLALSVALLCTALTCGCVQYPTEKQSVVDLRPQLSFKVDANDWGLAQARVVIDGLDAGKVGDFVSGKATLRVLSGSHVVQVIRDGTMVLDEKVYLGEGVSRDFLLK